MGREKRKETGSSARFSFTVIKELYKALIRETHSPSGKFNILVDAVLAIIIIVYLISNTATSVARIVSSIFNQELTGDTGDIILPLIFIFIAASLACLAFMWFVEREADKADRHINGKESR